MKVQTLHSPCFHRKYISLFLICPLISSLAAIISGARNWHRRRSRSSIYLLRCHSGISPDNFHQGRINIHSISDLIGRITQVASFSVALCRITIRSVFGRIIVLKGITRKNCYFEKVDFTV